ncbi:MAG: hypothetical protein LBG19_12290 [Prevotellaceae bacterium]|jgi:vacuolar-type H+-ATPase subunit H|nr:hypothetical protein [Prevotellaceae bacterium]
MGADEERVNVISNGLAAVLFSLSGMAAATEEIKKNIVKNARQKAVFYLRAVKLKGVDKFDPEKVKYDKDGDEMFESFSDVSWGLDDDDDYDADEELENILEDFTTELKKMNARDALIEDISQMLTEDITEPLESLEAAPSSVRGKYINGIRREVVYYLRAVKLHGAKVFAKAKELDDVSDDEAEFESFSDVEW